MTMSDQTETGLTTDTIEVTSSGEPPTTSSTASSDTSIDTSGYVSSTSTASPQSSASVNGGTGSDCGSVDCGGSSTKLTDFAASSNSGQKVNNNNCDASSTSAANGKTQQNGKLSPAEGITNGVALEKASSPTHFVSQAAVVHSVSHTPHTSFMNKVGGGTPNILHQPSSLPRGHSPHRYSPNTPHSRGNSPQNQGASPSSQQQNPQHIVLVHVNPGETFSVRVGEQIQHIQGPATVRMVSNNGPPLPMPMQVPPGHMVQQIVDENGILTHVILSPQPPGMAAPPMTGGPNGTPQQMYPAYGPQYPAYPAQYGPHPHPHPPHPHIHAPMPPPPGVHHTPPPHQCNSQHHPHIHPTAGPPPAHHSNHSPRGDERTHRQRQKLQDKIQRRNLEGYYNQNHIPASPGGGPRRTKPKVNGDVGGRRTVDTHHSGSSSSTDGNELEEERKTIRELLSKMKLPKVSDVEARSALIQLTAPECNQQEFDIDPSEFKYELQLSEKKDGKDGKYKSVYSGDATEITLKDLRPAAEYHLKVSSILDDLKGDATDPVSFKTMACEPDTPVAPKLTNRTKTSLLLKWNATPDNGAKISSYTLEFDQGRGDMNFVEIYNGLQRQFKVTKLSTSTGYTFRLAAINAVGKSEFSDPVCHVTSGSVPSQPDPPMLSEPYVKALTISWIKRPNDDEFILQMEDEATGHGFLTVYNGSNLSYKIKNLRRNTEYKYRLQASNEEGPSRWSDVVLYRTLPDRPGAPNKPSLKGKIHAHSFRIMWDSPKDTGGTDISKYLLELDYGRGPEIAYEGAERDFTCDHLEPGQTFQVRVSCVGLGGQSDWSDFLVVTTQAVAPGQCQPPKMQGKPRATSLHLRWLVPSYDGGSPVTEYEVQMTGPDNTTREVYKGRDLDCAVAGLLPGRPYLFQVRAVNRAGAGPWSDILEVLSGAGVPDPPKTAVVHCKSPHSAIIQWEEPVNNGATITEYRLEWQQRVEGEFSQIFFGPALSFEVKGLQPATLYNFRVQALNSAGAGPFSGTASCSTPPSSPGAVVSLRASATANSIHLSWREPPSHGSQILSYNIDLGERHLITVENILDHVIEDLIPETTYKIRVQAVNGIGVGAFSSLIKVTTHSLPPNPPRLECVSSGPNSLKLKWGDGKNLDLLQYCLEMLRDNGSFYPIYHGTGHSHKVNKLSELTDYEFRINASNEAGDGSYSEVFKFRTTIAPPPAVKAPRIEKLEETSCVVEWPACKPMGKDSIIYILQIQSLSDKEQEYRQLYRGPETSYRLASLACQSEHQVRVCAVRLCTDGSADLTGAFSPGVTFSMPVKPAMSASSSSGVSPTRATEHRQLSDQQWAMIILLGFALCAILIAFLAQKIIAYTSGSSSVESSSHSTSQGGEAGAP